MFGVGDRRSSVLSDQDALETIASGLESYTSQQAELQQAGSAAFPGDAAAKQQQAELAASLGTTPSADPELWAALMASLEEQGKQRARQLSRHLSDAAPELAGRLRQQRSDAMRCSEQGVTFFSPPDASSSADPGESSCDCGLVLPSFAGYPPAVREAVVGQLCNAYLQKEAEQEGVINGVPGCTQQLVLTTLGDGNCLSHACSLGVWGVHDRDGRLRTAIQLTMNHPVAGAAVQERFERQLERNGIPQEDWTAEWARELRSLQDSSTYLSDVHVFALANVLRRPLLIFADNEAALAGLSGIYLPCLWPEPRQQCSRQPLSILFGWSHFSLLCTVEGEGPASPPLLPMCTLGGPLQLRFLSRQEEQRAGGGSAGAGAGDAELAFLREYMDAERLFNGHLGVRLSERPKPHVLVSLLSAVYLQQVQEQQEAQEAQQQQPGQS